MPATMKHAPLLVLFCIFSVAMLTQPNAVGAYQAKADPVPAGQGEYVGEVMTESGKPAKVGVQIKAQGNSFRAVAYTGGLPGAGWNGKSAVEASGRAKDGAIVFAKLLGTAKLGQNVLTIADDSGKTLGVLKRIDRKSPTLNAKPPKEAIVLFGDKTNDFNPGKTEDGALTVPQRSKHIFAKDFTVHVEFRCPATGSGNSGVYLQNTYEIQVLNSFAKPKIGKGDCGGLYAFRVPDVNMSLPPMAWQTFDVDYKVGQFENGKLVKPPVVTVRHNGVVIHDKVELPVKNVSPKGGVLHLQSHGSPVNYRNIWVVEK